MMAAPEVGLRRLGENRGHARELGPPSAPGDVTDPDRQGLPILPFSSKAAWRAWLAANHDISKGLWLKIAKAGSANDSVTATRGRTARVSSLIGGSGCRRQ
jgi:hypothetical protein